MTAPTIESGSVLGVLGGGQLGAMFARAAATLGYRIAVWDPDPDAPAHRLADFSFAAPFTDHATVAAFAAAVSVVTYEWENVPADLCDRLEQDKPVRPSGGVLHRIQNRLVQKHFLAGQGLPVPRFIPMTDPAQLPDVLRNMGGPAICKTAMAGYDGKGQWKIDGPLAASRIVDSVKESARPGMQWIVEAYVPFERELSILAARSVDGRIVVYPLVENRHEQGILRTTLVPAVISADVAECAAQLARDVIERMEGVGVFCLELFLLSDQTLVINEVAPRPHNSGHYTLNACSVSQFEEQVRTVCGLPPEHVSLLSPAAMVNIIGDEIERIKQDPECRRLLALSGTFLHDYGKRETRPRRKMGHVTFLAPERPTVEARAEQLRERLVAAQGR
ncbi:MAG TPA: 5-(carboxyamino)imidazole ribonucleotide synthase [Nitrospira sp.]|nr:5-(carboxyamino)imidazole ribonucleotide synthase [Nitrospira sp.]